MRRTLIVALAVWALGVAILMGTSPVRAADEKAPTGSQPFVTVSVAGYDQLVKSVGLVGKLAGNPELAGMLEMPIQMMVGEDVVKGLDKSKPWGLVVKPGAGANDFIIQAFVPCKDVKGLMAALKKADLEAKAGEGGVFELKSPGGLLFVKQGSEGWTILANKKEALADIPATPETLLGGLDRKYLVAVSLAVKNVPEATRQQLMLPLMFAFQMSQQRRLPGESDEQAALRKKTADEAMQRLTTMVNDLDTLLIGVNVDEKANTAYLDLTVTAKPGTETAKKMGQTGELKSNFAGLIQPDATASLQMTAKIDPADTAQLKTNLASLRSSALAELEKQGLSEEQLKQGKQILGDLMDALEKSITSGTIDVAATLKLDVGKTSLVAGGQVAEGAKLESALKQLMEQVSKDEPELAKAIKLNAEEYSGIRFHVLTLPTAQLGEAAEGLSKMFGEKVSVIVGTADTSLYLAVGPDPASDLRQAIDQAKAQAGKAVPPSQFIVAATPIVRFAGAVGGAEVKPVVDKLLKGLQGSAGKDRVRMTTTSIPNGSQTRLELEEGLLKLLGSLPTLIGE